MKSKCVCCGNYITKSGLSDPYICRICEKESEIMELGKYAYLD